MWLNREQLDLIIGENVQRHERREHNCYSSDGVPIGERPNYIPLQSLLTLILDHLNLKVVRNPSDYKLEKQKKAGALMPNKPKTSQFDKELTDKLSEIIGAILLAINLPDKPKETDGKKA